VGVGRAEPWRTRAAGWRSLCCSQALPLSLKLYRSARCVVCLIRALREGGRDAGWWHGTAGALAARPVGEGLAGDVGMSAHPRAQGQEDDGAVAKDGAAGDGDLEPGEVPVAYPKSLNDFYKGKW
jgi:hypothetical protein